MIDLFGGAWDNLPTDEYVDKARELENEIKKALGEDTEISKNFTLDFKISNQEDLLSRFNNSIDSVLSNSKSDISNSTYKINASNKYKTGLGADPEIKNQIKQRNEFFSALAEQEQDYLDKFITENGINSADEIEFWLNETNGATNAYEAVAKYKKAKLESQELNVEDVSSTVENLQKEFADVNAIVYSDGEFTSAKYKKLLEFSKDYAEAIEYSNGVMKINTKKSHEIIQAKKEEAKATVSQAKAQQYVKYDKISKQIADEIKMLKQSTNADYSKINSLFRQQDAISSTISQYNLLAMSISEVSSAFDEYDAAVSGSHEGDWFNTSQAALKTMTTGYETGKVGTPEFEAAMRLLVPEENQGTPESVKNYIDDVLSNYIKMDDTTTDTNEEYQGLLNFLDSGTEKGVFSYDSESGYSLKENADGTLQTVEQIAEQYGMTEAAIRAIFGMLNDYSWGDNELKYSEAENAEDQKYIDNLTKQQELQKALSQLEEQKKKNPGSAIDTSGIENQIIQTEEENQQFTDTAVQEVDAWNKNEEALSDANEKLEAYNISKKAMESNPGLNTESKEYTTLCKNIEDAQTEVDKYTKKKEELGEPTALQFQVANEFNGIDQTYETLDNLRQQLAEAFSNSDVEGVRDLKIQLAEIPEEIRTKYYIDINSAETNYVNIEAIISKLKSKTELTQEDINNMAQSLSELPDEKKVELKLTGLTPEQIAKQINEDPSGFALKFTTDADDTKGKIDDTTSSVEKMMSTVEQGQALDIGDMGFTGLKDTATLAKEAVDNSASSYASLSAQPNINKTITFTTSYVTSGSPESTSSYIPGSGKPVKADGTAHAIGTALSGFNGAAFSGGDWGIKTAERALVNELGNEMLVRDGKWQIIEGGAQFVDLKKGDIIFNHKQTKELQDNGYVSSRGKLVGGSYAYGSTYGNAYAGSYGGNIIFIRPGKGDYTSPNMGNTSNSSSSYDYSDSNSNYDSGSGETDTKEQFDWIERALKRIDRAVKNFGQTAGNVFRKLTTRAKALGDEYKTVADQIKTNTSAAQRYLSEADSLGLSSEYAKKVKDGTIDIESITDEDLQKTIKSYQAWYDKATELEDKNEELKQTLSEIAETKFTNIAEQYDGLLNILENKASILDSYISLSEANGQIVSSKYYTEQYKYKKEDLGLLEKKRNEMNTQLSDMLVNGDIEGEDSEKYKEMKSAIQEVDNAIVSTQVDMAELNNTIRQLAWDKFDSLQERISDVADESDFLIKLIGDDNLFDKDTGEETDNYKAVMGLHHSNYNVYQEQANKYAQEIKAINESLAKDPNNQLLIDRKKELINAQHDSILAAQDELQAALDLKEQGYEAQLDALQKIVDKKKEALDIENDLFNYQKNVADQTKKIAELQKQYDTYANDNSEEGKKKRQELGNSLKDAKENLKETEYDKYISDQKEILDNLATEYEENFNDKLNNQEELFKQLIDETNNNSASISDTIQKTVADVGYTLSDSIKTIWGSDNPVSSFIGGSWSNYATGTIAALNNIAKKMGAEQVEADINASKDIANSNTNNSNIGKTPTPKPPDPTPPPKPSKPEDDKSLKYVKNWYYRKTYYPKHLLNKEISIDDRLAYYDFDSSNDKVAEYYAALGGSGSYKGTAQQNTWLIQQMKAQGYSSGGTIGNLVRATGEDGFILAKSGEEVLSIPKLKLLKSITSDWLKTQISLPKISTDIMPGKNNMGNVFVEFTGDILVDGTKNGQEIANDFTDSIKNSSKVRNAIVSLTTDAITGKNSLNYRKR